MEPPRRLAPPALRRGIVSRPRLSRLLERGAEASLTLVTAAPGYGKTVAVETWLAELEHAVAWVRADARDDDPIRLWSSVATAVERVRPGAGTAALAQLGQPSGLVLSAIEALASGLDAQEHGLVLVIDDLQLIDDARCLRSVDDAIDSLPANVQLVLISRTVPSLRLGRLRAQGQLVEVDAAELAFTVAEARELFAAIDGLSADEATVAAMTRRTEGWAAALYLAALWLRKRGDPAAAVRTFRGSQHDVSDFLAGEVLRGLEPDTLAFLRNTAVLPQMCGELCDAIIPASDSGERLRELERENLLVIPLVGRIGWFRYHSLLRDRLLADLDSGEETLLRRRALAWSRDHGFVEDAAEYARVIGDSGALIALLDDHALRLLRAGRARTLVRWTSAIARPTLVAHPQAVVIAAAAAHVSGLPSDEVRRMLAVALRAAPAVDDADAAAMLQILRAFYTDDDVGEAVLAAQSAVELSRGGEELLVTALAALSLVRLLAGDDEEAAVAAHAALQHPDAARRTYGHLTAEATLAILEARAGRRHSARRHADAALAVTREARLNGLPATTPTMLANALATVLEGRLAGAQRAARQAATTAIPGGMWEAWALLELASIELRRGSRLVAADTMAHADEVLGAMRDAGALAALAASLRGALDSAPEQQPEPLSPAELAVLRLLPGRTVQEIAGVLYLSANTVKSHVRAIYRKLGVKTREDAVARAAALGLADDAELGAKHAQ